MFSLEKAEQEVTAAENTVIELRDWWPNPGPQDLPSSCFLVLSALPAAG